MHARSFAPVVLFVFARPGHTKITLDRLRLNVYAPQTDLIIYSDAARNSREECLVRDVRELIRSIKGFRSLKVIERETNYGLAGNIIEGVTEVCGEYGKVIVLEDDIVTSPFFLKYMNDALDFYSNDLRVWHISGWNYPIDSEELGDAFFLRIMNCWGWGTWNNRWINFERNTDKIIAEFDRDMITRLDLDGTGVFWSQVMHNHQKRINTWGIYWYVCIFKNRGLCLNPTISYVDNIGHDGSGIHKSKAGRTYSSALNETDNPRFPIDVSENPVAIERIRMYYKAIAPSLPEKIGILFHEVRRRVLRFLAHVTEKHSCV